MSKNREAYTCESIQPRQIDKSVETLQTISAPECENVPEGSSAAAELVYQPRLHAYIDGENFRLHTRQAFTARFEIDPKKFVQKMCAELGYELGEVNYYSSCLPYPDTVEHNSQKECAQYLHAYHSRECHKMLSRSKGVTYFAPPLQLVKNNEGAVLQQKEVDMKMGIDCLLKVKADPRDAILLVSFDKDFMPVLKEAKQHKEQTGSCSLIFTPSFVLAPDQDNKSKKAPRPLALSGTTQKAAITQEFLQGCRFNASQWKSKYQYVRRYYAASLEKSGRVIKVKPEASEAASVLVAQETRPLPAQSMVPATTRPFAKARLALYEQLTTFLGRLLLGKPESTIGKLSGAA